MSGLLHECIRWLGPRSPLGPGWASVLTAAVSMVGIIILLPVVFWLLSPLIGFLAHLIGWRWTAPVKHMDETRLPDWRQDAMAAYRLDEIWLTFYRTSPKRGNLLAKATGIMA